MAQVWKIIADTLESTAHLLPPPADSAVGLVCTIARLTQKALEGKRGKQGESAIYRAAGESRRGYGEDHREICGGI
jgi:hypothetical protein